MSEQDFRAGFVAVVGRPNVGKSTLVNALLGHKVSIVTSRPQTTRHRILGILNRERAQLILVDTPGLHRNARKAINRGMNRAASASIGESEIIAFVVEALHFTAEDEDVLARIKESGLPTVLVLSKIDKVKPKERLLPFIKEVSGRHAFVAVVPVSARSSKNLDNLERELLARLPPSEPLYPRDKHTDRPESFMAAEIVREKLMQRLHQELPYGLTVEIEQFAQDEEGRVAIRALIWVERSGHKAIVIGKSGETLKAVGRDARLELKRRLGKPVHLELWVKVLENWSDSERALQRFGYESA